MLAYFLATLMAITSLILFLNAFISPKTHRQDDFLWSGLGLFYALILWLCAGRFTGVVLLGQIAAVLVTIAFVWENRQLRKAITAESDSNAILEGFSVLNLVAQSLAKISAKEKTVPATTPESVVPEGKPEVIKSEESTPTVTEETVSKETEAEKEIVTEEKAEETITSDTESESPVVEDSAQTQTVEEESTEKSLKETPVIKEEGTTNAEEETITDTENQQQESQEEEDFLGSSLVTESEAKERKPNIFSRILGIFRKSEPEKQEIQSNNDQVETQPQMLDETVDEIDVLEDDVIAEANKIAENIDPKTTITEVEEAIENLELSDTSENNPDEQEETETQEVSVTEEEIEADNDTLTVTDEAEEVTSEDETILEISDENDEVEVEIEIEDSNILQTSEDNIDGQITEKSQEESQANTIEEKKEEMATNESSGEPTAENVPEDDIIESLSDLFPKQDESSGKNEAESVQKKTGNNENEGDGEVDELTKLFEDDDQPKKKD